MEIFNPSAHAPQETDFRLPGTQGILSDRKYTIREDSSIITNLPWLAPEPIY
jgi:hypothetical protein